MAIGNNHISIHDNVRPRLSFILYIIETGSKGNKNTYFNSTNTGNTVLIDLQFKWSKNLNDEIRLDTFANSFKNAKKYSPSVYQHFIQYKLLHRRIVHKRSLKLRIVYIVIAQKLLNMYILNVLMLDNYGEILKIGLEYYTTLTLKFQILRKFSVKNIMTILNTLLSSASKMLYT